MPDYFARANLDQKNLYGNEKIESYELIKEFLKEQDIKLVDIQELVFKNHSDPLSLFPFRGFGHFNEEGYKLVAESIIKLDD